MLAQDSCKDMLSCNHFFSSSSYLPYCSTETDNLIVILTWGKGLVGESFPTYSPAMCWEWY